MTIGGPIIENELHRSTGEVQHVAEVRDGDFRRFDRASRDLQVPIAPKVRRAGPVVGRGDVGARRRRQFRQKLLTTGIGADHASVQHDVAGFGQGLAQRGEISSAAGQIFRRQRHSTKTNGALGPVREDMNGVIPASSFCPSRHLRQPVLTRLQDHNFQTVTNGVRQNLMVLHTGIDEDDLPPLVLFARRLMGARRRVQCGIDSTIMVIGGPVVFGRHGLGRRLAHGVHARGGAGGVEHVARFQRDGDWRGVGHHAVLQAAGGAGGLDDLVHGGWDPC
nr:hypothetical protein [Caenispirillum salinarum]